MERSLSPLKWKTRFNKLVLSTPPPPGVVKIKWKLIEELYKCSKNKLEYIFEGQSARSNKWLLLEHDWIQTHFKKKERYFYNQMFQRNITGQENSIYITFYVPIGSAKIHKLKNFIPHTPEMNVFKTTEILFASVV